MLTSQRILHYFYHAYLNTHGIFLKRLFRLFVYHLGFATEKDEIIHMYCLPLAKILSGSNFMSTLTDPRTELFGFLMDFLCDGGDY